MFVLPSTGPRILYAHHFKIYVTVSDMIRSAAYFCSQNAVNVICLQRVVNHDSKKDGISRLISASATLKRAMENKIRRNNGGIRLSV